MRERGRREREGGRREKGRREKEGGREGGERGERGMEERGRDGGERAGGEREGLVGLPGRLIHCEREGWRKTEDENLFIFHIHVFKPGLFSFNLYLVT